MDSKLTLKLDSTVIDRAKSYARNKNTSVSNLVESYLNLLTEPSSNESEVTPLVKSLSGVIDPGKHADYKKSYKNHLVKKYTKS